MTEHRTCRGSARFLSYLVVVACLSMLLLVQLKYSLEDALITSHETRGLWNETFQILGSAPCHSSDGKAASDDDDDKDDGEEEVFYEFSTDRPGCRPVKISSKTFVSIFIITRDRVNGLRESIESYDKTISSPFETVILDHNSTYPPMLEYLQHLQTQRNVTILPLTNPKWTDAMLEADRLILDYLKPRPHVKFYVATDPDIALKRTAPDILLYYAAILNSCKDVRVVGKSIVIRHVLAFSPMWCAYRIHSSFARITLHTGPHLQISDLPSYYTRKASLDKYTVFEWESRFWTSVPSMATWKGLG